MQQTFKSLFTPSQGEPNSPKWTSFIKDYHWMHIVSTLANHEYLKIDRILEEHVMDVYAYLQYIDAKAEAERAQMKFHQERMDKMRK